jgi:hypothetical protein
MIIRVLAPALPHLRPALRLAGPARLVSASKNAELLVLWHEGAVLRRTIPGRGSTGPTAQSSPRSSGSCPGSCERTGWSPPAPSCAGTAA